MDQLTFWHSEIPASETPIAGGMGEATRLQRLRRCAFLTRFSLTLFSGKIRQPSERMPSGRGTECAENWKTEATRLLPSESGRVALALTSDGTACSCSPNMRSPTARDWKGMSAKSWRERTTGDNTPTLPDQIGGTPHPEYYEELMGFPIVWSELRG